MANHREEEPRIVSGARWDCHQCSLCCRMLALGPVAPERVEALEALGIRDAWPPAAEGWYDSDRRGLWLKKRDGACIFLRQDNLCAVHALYGAEAKPVFCRTFPFHLVDEPGGGLAVAVREDCGGGPESMEGTLVADQVATLPADAFRHDFSGVVMALPGVGVSAADWLLLEPRLMAAVDDDRSPAANVAAIRDVLFTSLRREPPPADPVRAAQAVADLAAGLADLLRQRVRGEGWVEGFLTELELDLGGGLDPVLGAVERAWFAGVLRQQILGKRVVRHRGAPRWLGTYVLLTDLAARSPAATMAAHVRLARLALHPLFARLEARRVGALRQVFLFAG